MHVSRAILQFGRPGRRNRRDGIGLFKDRRFELAMPPVGPARQHQVVVVFNLRPRIAEICDPWNSQLSARTARPMRWMLCGGPVVATASTGCSCKYWKRIADVWPNPCHTCVRNEEVATKPYRQIFAPRPQRGVSMKDFVRLLGSPGPRSAKPAIESPWFKNGTSDHLQIRRDLPLETRID